MTALLYFDGSGNWQDANYSEILTDRINSTVRAQGLDADLIYTRYFILERLERMLALGTDRDEDSPKRIAHLDQTVGFAGYTFANPPGDTYIPGEAGICEKTHAIAVYDATKMTKPTLFGSHSSVFLTNPLEALVAVLIPK